MFLTHLRQRLLALAMNGRGLGWGSEFAARGTPALARRGHRVFWSSSLPRSLVSLH
jgi:hypothetical protein